MTITATPTTTPTAGPATDTAASEPDFLAQYDPSKYPPVAVTVDIVVLTISQGRLSVLLVERADHPFQGAWALPGGFIEPDEPAIVAAARELMEETSVETMPDEAHLEQLGTYTAPNRDPRMRVVSIAHLAMMPAPTAPVGGDDAAQARFWPIEDLDLAGTGDGIELAFDHAQVITDGIERARAKLEYTPLATAFVQEPFSVADLRRVYEAVWGVELDASNFRRKVIDTPGFVTAVKHKPRKPGPGSTGGRPAALYRRGDTQLLHPAMLRGAVDTAKRGEA